MQIILLLVRVRMNVQGVAGRDERLQRDHDLVRHWDGVQEDANRCGYEMAAESRDRR